MFLNWLARLLLLVYPVVAHDLYRQDIRGRVIRLSRAEGISTEYLSRFLILITSVPSSYTMWL